jgi:integration host factor subunit alpha
MIKTDIVEHIQARTNFSNVEALGMLETLLSIMKDTLEAGESIKVVGFGNFEVKEKNERIGRDPSTGEALTINARRVITFKPSAILKSAINGRQ